MSLECNNCVVRSSQLRHANFVRTLLEHGERVTQIAHRDTVIIVSKVVDACCKFLRSIVMSTTNTSATTNTSTLVSLSSKNVFFVDLQGLKTSTNMFIVKELAVLSIKGNYALHKLYQPQFDISQLDPHTQVKNLWISQRFHGLSWNSGKEAYNEIYKDLRDIADTMSPCLFLVK